jgi:uncharacterized membrane protein YcjF (UPF0283 family)
MNEDKRKPGRIEDEAVPIDGTQGTTKPHDKDSVAGTTARADATYADHIVGYVDEPTVAISDDIIEDDPQQRELVTHRPSVWKPVLLAICLLFAGWVVYSLSSLTMKLWESSPWYGLPFVFLVSLFLVVLARALYVEYRALYQVDTLAVRQKQIGIAIETGSVQDLKDVLDPAMKNLRIRFPDLMAEFDAAAGYRNTSADYFTLFENVVLIHLDDMADNLIRRSTLVTGASVAIIPHASLDAVVVLWRSIKLVREIGDIYGLAPTGMSSLKLLKQSLTSAVIVAAVQLSGEEIAKLLGESMVIKALPGAAVGAATAWRIYRLGYNTKLLCRPAVELSRV